jgi:U3 small nucleolar ribonucleoprotein component
MKHVSMKQRKEKPIPVRPPRERKTEAAFDLWLQRGLHKLFDDVAQERIPEELLRLIEEDRSK